MKQRFELRPLKPSEVFAGLKNTIEALKPTLRHDGGNFLVYELKNPQSIHIVHLPGTDINDNSKGPSLGSFLPSNVQEIPAEFNTSNTHHHIVIAEAEERNHFVYAHIHNHHLAIYDSMPRFPKNYKLDTAIAMIKSAFDKHDMTHKIEYLNLQLGNEKCGFHCIQFFDKVIKGVPITKEKLTMFPQHFFGEYIRGENIEPLKPDNSLLSLVSIKLSNHLLPEPSKKIVEFNPDEWTLLENTPDTVVELNQPNSTPSSRDDFSMDMEDTDKRLLNNK